MAKSTSSVDDQMSLSTISHIVKYCHQQPNDQQTIEHVIGRVQAGLLRETNRFSCSSLYNDRKPFPASRVRANAVARSNASAMLGLPNEMLLTIRDFLDEPADAISLGLTCKRLYQLLDYKFLDLYKAGNAVIGLPEHSMTAVLNGEVDMTWVRNFSTVADTQRFLLTDRLDRDWLQRRIIEETSTQTGQLACSVCVQWHDRTSFSAEQQAAPADIRSCIRASTPIRMCEHWQVSLPEIRSLRRFHKTSTTSLFEDDYEVSCGHASHALPVGNGDTLFRPHVSSSSLGYFVHWTRALRSRISNLFGADDEDPDEVTADLTATFTASPSLRQVCAHLAPITDENVKFFVETADEIFAEKDFKTYCDECGMNWSVRATSKWVAERQAVEKVWELDTWVHFDRVRDAGDWRWRRWVDNQRVFEVEEV